MRRGKKADREKEKYGKEEDTWSGQDRRANGGHRTEMASGSAFQYSTLATLGHPTSSAPRLPPSCPPSCSSASSASLSLVPTPRPLRAYIYMYTHTFFLSFFTSFLPSLRRFFLLSRSRRSPSPPRSHPSQTEAQHPPLDLESFYFAPPHS